jgi:hypothetical protein
VTRYLRYAIYHLPEGALGRWGEDWLGWEMARGVPRPRPEIPGLPRPIADLTAAATVYGLHATIKPPFRLAPGRDAAGLSRAVGALAARTRPAEAPGLRLARLDGFLALVPDGESAAIDAVAARAVADLDSFRAPPAPAELARRRAAGLSPRQDALLLRWGYPWVMEEFRFHITLSGRLDDAEAAAVAAALGPQLAPILPRPFRLGALSVVGEMEGGGFRLISHHPFSG